MKRRKPVMPRTTGNRVTRAAGEGRALARTIDVTQEAELAIERLLTHLANWLVQQPEWPILMGASGRVTRRRVARLIAAELVTIPTAVGSPYGGNRALRRQLIQELRRAEDNWWEGVHVEPEA